MMWGNQRKQKEALIKENESWLHEELITTFNGRHKVPLCIFTAEELIRATNNFIHPINRNPYFYGGSLEQCSVLVKNPRYPCICRQEQIHDIVITSQMSHHKNVWKLVGCCLEFENPVMVYENNVGVDILDDLLFYPYETDDTRILAWTSRLRIAIDIASAIVYLHMAFPTPTPIVYRNLSAQNIVVDRSGVGKLFDFSNSISLPPGELELQVNRVVGEFSFMAPEYMWYGTVSQKIDVYAFGILLLVLLTGKKGAFLSDLGTENAFSSDMESPDFNLASYVGGKEFNEIVDPKILSEGGGTEHEHQLQAFLQLALKCIQREAENRPEMLDVAKELRKIKKYLG